MVARGWGWEQGVTDCRWAQGNPFRGDENVPTFIIIMDAQYLILLKSLNCTFNFFSIFY